MNSNILERRFAEMGARAFVSGSPVDQSIFRRQPRRIILDIGEDKRGEFYTVRLAEGVEAEVVNVDKEGRHLLLHVKDGTDKSKFLCGHDERHWFVAAIPESAPGVTTVAKAKEALQPDSVRGAAKSLKSKHRYSRRNGAFARQGEWFFTPVDIDPPADLILKNEPITRGRGKPHNVEFLYRLPGDTVYTRRSRGDSVTLTQREYNRLDPQERKLGWTVRTSVSEVYAKGRISHADHATITLAGWHRIEMNTEQKARAMQHVAFID